MEYRIELHPDVPRETALLREWLRKWHAKHNGIMTTKTYHVPDYQLTEKGRLWLTLAGKEN